GWLVVPDTLAAQLEKVIEYNFSCMFEPVQRAAAAALIHGEDHIKSERKKLTSNHHLLAKSLRSIEGVSVPDTGGAMYTFFKVDGQNDSVEFAKQLVNAVGLGLAPGSAFGTEGNGWLRWCHAVDKQKLTAGIERFSKYMGKR
nr:hypothetical protein [Tanacetum cinerariifolium]